MVYSFIHASVGAANPLKIIVECPTIGVLTDLVVVDRAEDRID
jgi:hypothetical protein